MTRDDFLHLKAGGVATQGGILHFLLRSTFPSICSVSPALSPFSSLLSLLSCRFCCRVSPCCSTAYPNKLIYSTSATSSSGSSWASPAASVSTMLLFTPSTPSGSSQAGSTSSVKAHPNDPCKNCLLNLFPSVHLMFYSLWKISSDEKHLRSLGSVLRIGTRIYILSGVGSVLGGFFLVSGLKWQFN